MKEEMVLMKAYCQREERLVARHKGSLWASQDKKGTLWLEITNVVNGRVSSLA